MTERFKIPYPPTAAGKKAWSKQYGLNRFYAGTHWAERKKAAEYWHMLTRSEMRKQGVGKRIFKSPVCITFWWNDRLDIDNHSIMGKMIVDAMKGIVIADDDRRHLTGITHLWHDQDYILVEVSDMKGNGHESKD